MHACMQSCHLDTPSNKFNDNKSAAGIIKGLKAIDKEQ